MVTDHTGFRHFPLPHFTLTHTHTHHVKCYNTFVHTVPDAVLVDYLYASEYTTSLMRFACLCYLNKGRAQQAELRHVTDVNTVDQRFSNCGTRQIA